MRTRITAGLGLLLALGVAFPVLWSRARAADLPQLGSVPPFTLTDEQGRPFGSQQLHGRPYVADFIYTGCHESCPLLTARMSQLQGQTRDVPEWLHLVTFTVDPAHDTPETLHAYAKKAGANPARWSFLTGPAPVLSSLLNDGFKVVMDKIPKEGTPVHDDHLILVDGGGHIRGYFSADEAGLRAIRAAVKQLWKAP